jgi:hypothetical protein
MVEKLAVRVVEFLCDFIQASAGCCGKAQLEAHRSRRARRTGPLEVNRLLFQPESRSAVP